jgi:hypothetical protein
MFEVAISVMLQIPVILWCMLVGVMSIASMLSV